MIHVSRVNRPEAKCRSCGADVLWATMKDSGKKIPLDAQPSPTGNLWCQQKSNPPHLELLAFPALPVDHPGLDTINQDRRRWVSHFATCPNAGEHRKPKQLGRFGE